MLSDQDFLAAADGILANIQFQAEEWFDTREDLDIDVFRSGNVVTIIFENGTQVIVNSQEPKKEMWMAAKSGGYHFYYDSTRKLWIDTKSKEEFYAVFLDACRAQSGQNDLSLR